MVFTYIGAGALQTDTANSSSPYTTNGGGSVALPAVTYQYTTESAALSSCTVTPSGAKNRVVITAVVHATHLTGAATVTIRIKEGAAILASTTLAIDVYANYSKTLTVTLVDVSVAAHTYSVTLASSTGTGASSSIGISATPISLV